MTFLAIAAEIEARKFMAARVPVATTVLFALGVTAIAAGMTLAAGSGDPAVVAKLGVVAQLRGWDLLAAVVLQVTAAASVVAFGVVLSWSIGREFADGTITGLFAVPVPRQIILVGKLIVYLLWTLVAGLALVALVAIVGGALRLAAPSSGTIASLLLKILLLVALSGLIAVPAAWAATLGRGLLAGIGATVGIVAIAQISAISGAGAWFPFTAPALWALDAGAVGPLQFSLVATVPLLFGLLSLRSWAGLQLDR